MNLIVYSYAVQILLHFMKAVRQRALELHIPAGGRADKANKVSMEQLSGEELIRFSVITVCLVSDHRVTSILHMHPDLVGPPGLQPELEEREAGLG